MKAASECSEITSTSSTNTIKDLFRKANHTKVVHPGWLNGIRLFGIAQEFYLYAPLGHQTLGGEGHNIEVIDNPVDQ